MVKKSTLIIGLIVLILLIFGGYILFAGESVNVYMDGENITSQMSISPFAGVDSNKLNEEICNYTSETMNSTNGTAQSLKQGILRICLSHGLDNVKVHLKIGRAHV